MQKIYLSNVHLITRFLASLGFQACYYQLHRWVWIFVYVILQCPFAEVCMFRLDFESFNLLAGSTTVEADPGYGCQDEFNVNGLGTAQRIPIICGSNNGQHSKRCNQIFNQCDLNFLIHLTPVHHFWGLNSNLMVETKTIPEKELEVNPEVNPEVNYRLV